MKIGEVLTAISDLDIPGTITPPPPTSSTGWANVKDYGAVGDGLALDSTAIQAALDAAKACGIGIYVPRGRYLIDATLSWDRSSDPANSQGLVMRGDGPMATVFVNAIVVGGPTLDLTTGGTAKYQFGGSISDIGFESAGSGVNSHAIKYRSCWHQVFKNLRFSGMNGAGLKVINTAADADASSQVMIENIYAVDCVGPAFDSTNGSGGVALHSLKQINAVNCGIGGTAYVVLDGCIQLSMDMCSMSGTGTAIPLVHMKSTNVRTRQIRITDGEYGNNCGTHFKIDAVSSLHVSGIRHVRRASENNSTIGFDFADGVSLYSGIRIENIEAQIDDASPVWTWMRLGTGLDSNGKFEVDAPNPSNFAAGNVLYAFNAGAKQKGYILRGNGGAQILSPPKKRQRVTFASVGTITPDFTDGSWYQALLNASGAYTVAAPIGGAMDGRTVLLTIFKDNTVTVTWSATYEAPAMPVLGGTFEFAYDATSSMWRLVA